jgi:ABC-type sugar transport system ATPase subunit
LQQKDLIKAMVGREINDLYGVKGENNKHRFHKNEVVLEVQDLTDINHYVRDISFSVCKGEIAGFSGLVGAGRSELVRCIFGANKRAKGKVFLNGEEIKPDSIRACVEKKIGFVTEDRKNDGILQEISVLKNICLVDLAAGERILIDQKRDEKNCDQMINQLSIKVMDIDDPVKKLSGGNQQKLLLAKWLLLDPVVLIVDEPTRGVDIGAKADIYEIMRKLAEKGIAIIVVSSELPEVLGICDTIYVMREGQITAKLNVDEADEETIGYYSTIGKGV